ncbi:sensor histidine kinase [Myroides sp. LJL115]
MKIKARLRLWFSILVGALLLVFATVVYWSSAKNREVEFFQELEKEAITKARLVLEAKVKPNILQQIYKNNNQELNEVEVAVYSSDFQLIYHDDLLVDRVKETQEMIDLVRSQGSMHLRQEDWQIIAIVYPYQGQEFIITAVSYDQYGYTKLHNLLVSIIVMSIISLIVIFYIGGFFADRILRPIQSINKQIKSISASSLHTRVVGDSNKDELSDLANNFNLMLDRLEASFTAQKDFVSNMSHELRTPLAAVIAEIELALIEPQSPANYKVTLTNILQDSNKLVHLSNSLLDLAKASYDPTQIVFKHIRIDEVILDCIHKIQRKNPQSKFDFILDPSLSEEGYLEVFGNAYLLQVAFLNLLDNACKFSENQLCTILLSYELEYLVIKITDKGPGICPKDLPHIFKAFYRGASGYQVYGSGIGLALTHKIVVLHKADLQVESQLGHGSCFTLRLNL